MNQTSSTRGLPPGRARLLAPAALIFLTLTAGCGKHDVRSYQVPKEMVPTGANHPALSAPPPPAETVEVPHWKLPSG
ncbi:MAG TPA: hypothetical protein VF720_06815, partial [Candidatus Eisenbacteria bacterium]